MRVLSRVGVLIAPETSPGVYVQPTQTVKVESVITPNIEFDTVELPNFSFFGGTADVATIADWGRASIEIQTSLYRSLSFYETLFAISNLKKTALLDNDPANPNPNDADSLSDGWKFVPWTHSSATASLDLVLPDRRFKIKGAKSSFKMSGKVGDRVQVIFNVQGSYEDREIAPQTLADTAGDEIMFNRRLGGMTLNGVSINMSEFEFDMNSTLAYEKFTNVGEFHLSDYAPKLTLKMRLEDGGADGFEEFKSGATMDFVADFRDASGKVIWRLFIPKAKLSTQPSFEDSEGIFVITREFKALSSAGDDNFALYYFI